MFWKFHTNLSNISIMAVVLITNIGCVLKELNKKRSPHSILIASTFILPSHLARLLVLCSILLSAHFTVTLSQLPNFPGPRARPLCHASCMNKIWKHETAAFLLKCVRQVSSPYLALTFMLGSCLLRRYRRYSWWKISAILVHRWLNWSVLRHERVSGRWKCQSNVDSIPAEGGDGCLKQSERGKALRWGMRSAAWLVITTETIAAEDRGFLWFIWLLVKYKSRIPPVIAGASPRQSEQVTELNANPCHINNLLTRTLLCLSKSTWPLSKMSSSGRRTHQPLRVSWQLMPHSRQIPRSTSPPRTSWGSPVDLRFRQNWPTTQLIKSQTTSWIPRGSGTTPIKLSPIPVLYTTTRKTSSQ